MAEEARLALPGGLKLLPGDLPAAARAGAGCILLSCLIAVLADRIALPHLPASYVN